MCRPHGDTCLTGSPQLVLVPFLPYLQRMLWLLSWYRGYDRLNPCLVQEWWQKGIVIGYGIWYILARGVIVLQGGSLPNSKEKGGGVMDTYEILTLLMLFGTFLIALLAYIDKRK